jgi:hypothetical protein
MFSGVLIQSTPPFDVAPETLEDARWSGRDYGELLRRCEKGEDAALKELLNLSDHYAGNGASAIGHGAAMVEILWKVGDEPFSRALGALSPTSRSNALFLLGAGLEYTFVSEHRTLPSDRFARMLKALQEVGGPPG